jgi:hypothetical protein
MIQIGQKVYSILYGGRNGVIYAIHGEQRPQSAGSIGGVIRTGGNAYFDIVFTNGTESKLLPEAILYGVQWKVFPEVAGADEIRSMLDFAASETARKKAEETKKSEEFSATVAALKADPHHSALQQTGQGAQFSKLVAINLRREFKSAFPGVKFSVKCSGYDSVTVAWIDGPTKASVEAITSKYSGGHFDGMDDMYHHTTSPWTSVFGSAKYISVTRKHSIEAMTNAVDAVSKAYGWPRFEVKTSFDGSAFIGSHDFHEQKAISDFLEQRLKIAAA